MVSSLPTVEIISAWWFIPVFSSTVSSSSSLLCTPSATGVKFVKKKKKNCLLAPQFGSKSFLSRFWSNQSLKILPRCPKPRPQDLCSYYSSQQTFWNFSQICRRSYFHQHINFIFLLWKIFSSKQIWSDAMQVVRGKYCCFSLIILDVIISRFKDCSTFR